MLKQTLEQWLAELEAAGTGWIVCAYTHPPVAGGSEYAYYGPMPQADAEAIAKENPETHFEANTKLMAFPLQAEIPE